MVVEQKERRGPFTGSLIISTDVNESEGMRGVSQSFDEDGESPLFEEVVLVRRGECHATRYVHPTNARPDMHWL